MNAAERTVADLERIWNRTHRSYRTVSAKVDLYRSEGDWEQQDNYEDERSRLARLLATVEAAQSAAASVAAYL